MPVRSKFRWKLREVVRNVFTWSLLLGRIVLLQSLDKGSWMSFRVILVLSAELNSNPRVTERDMKPRTEAVRSCDTDLNRLQPMKWRWSNCVTDRIGTSKTSCICLSCWLVHPWGMIARRRRNVRLDCPCWIRGRWIWSWRNGLIELCENDFLVVSGAFVSQSPTNRETVRDLIETSACSRKCQIRSVIHEMPWWYWRHLKCSVGGLDAFIIVMHRNWMVNERHLSDRDRNCFDVQGFIDLRTFEIWDWSDFPVWWRSVTPTGWFNVYCWWGFWSIGRTLVLGGPDVRVENFTILDRFFFVDLGDNKFTFAGPATVRSSLDWALEIGGTLVLYDISSDLEGVRISLSVPVRFTTNT